MTEIKIVNKCLKQCPTTYKSLEVIVNKAQRRCMIKFSEDSPQEHDLPILNETDDVYHNLMKLKVRYDEEIMIIKDKSLEKMEDDGTAKYSSECYYNGVLRKEMRGDLDSYYICRCNENYLGDNCQISRVLFKETQTKLIQQIKLINKMIGDKSIYKKKIFLESLILMNKFKIGKTMINKIIFLIQQYLQKDKEIENKKKLYVLYDAILLNLFDLLEDQRKMQFSEYNIESDLQAEKGYLYQQINDVVLMIEDSLEDHVYLNSFLDKNSTVYMPLDTYSYSMTEYKLSSFSLDLGLVSRNPNIDTSFNLKGNNKLFLQFKDQYNPKTSELNIQIITFASPLFKVKIEKMLYHLVSNVMYIKVLSGKEPHKEIQNNFYHLKKY